MRAEIWEHARVDLLRSTTRAGLRVAGPARYTCTQTSNLQQAERDRNSIIVEGRLAACTLMCA
jgi:hypothetical protein